MHLLYLHEIVQVASLKLRWYFVGAAPPTQASIKTCYLVGVEKIKDSVISDWTLSRDFCVN